MYSSAGTQSRQRNIVTSAQNAGAECPSLTEVQECNTQYCPQECQFSNPMEWDNVCVGVCGTGQKKMINYMTDTAVPADPNCVDMFTWVPCTLDKLCPCTDFNTWTEWSACNVTCGAGITTRTRSPLQPCDSSQSVLTQTLPCTGPCPTDCVLTQWSEWGACSKICGVAGGIRTRTRSVDQPAQVFWCTGHGDLVVRP